MSVQVIGWALVHSLWQGALIAAVATIALAFAWRSSAHRRYGICLTALLLIAAAPVVTSAFLIGANQRRSAERLSSRGSNATEGPAQEQLVIQATSRVE